MVMVLELQLAVTPLGSPVAVHMPVAPVVVWVIFVRGKLTHKVGLEDAEPAVLAGVTVIVPVASTDPQPPESGMV